MKALSLDIILTRCSTRADKSLSLSMVTPELDPSEMQALFELQGKNLKALIQPLEQDAEEIVTVKREIDTKTPSQRLRSVIWHLWKQNEHGEAVNFEVFYSTRIESYIEQIKTKLHPVT